MRPTDWFAVGVRLIAVWMLVQAADEAVLLCNAELGYYRTAANALAYAVHGGADVIVALALFICVKPLTTLAGPWEANGEGAMRCPTCGYDLRATPGRCPECGPGGPA